MVPALLLTLSVACGCAGDEDSMQCPGLPMEGAALSIGGGDELGLAFEPFEPGADRPLVFGTQGGFHVWMHLRAEGLCPGSNIVETRVFAPDGDMALFQRQPMPFDDAGEGIAELRAATPLILCPSPGGDVVQDVAYRVTVEVADRDGRVASAESRFVAVCDPATQGGGFVDDCRCLCGLEGC